MITSTMAPPCTSLLATSAALYAAIEPVTPRTTVLPSRGGCEIGCIEVILGDMVTALD